MPAGSMLLRRAPDWGQRNHFFFVTCECGHASRCQQRRLCLPVRLSVFLSLWLSPVLSICLSAHLCFRLPLCLSVCLSDCPTDCLSVCVCCERCLRACVCVPLQLCVCACLRVRVCTYIKRTRHVDHLNACGHSTHLILGRGYVVKVL